MDLIKTIEEQQKKPNAEYFSVGDTVKVHFEIIEGKTKRIQIYEGLVICFKNSGISKTFTVRKTSYGVGVERVFPVNSPRIIKVEIVRLGKVRRSKIYYVRDKVGKAAKIKELLGPKANAKLAAAKAANAAEDKKEAAINAEHKAEEAAASAAAKAKK
ncbi:MULTISPECIES: 50S ribosomal protein L19 [unclassified Treponema]|uniref:50S ribosomal protein L19 n=1 Tax=unclassified Treponema TaxID=2638727 RepID=UPI000E872FC4|nr:MULTISPECIES: 50S ribosomal protein L19 [unclassified Treponema]MDO5774354.1 50S ribosomal protein L19 [Spirochaetales bacterium]HAZ96032.1 50S ribosomal protein L19 [Treponema sp.]